MIELAEFIRDEASSDAHPRLALDFDIEVDEATTPPEHTRGSSEILTLCGCQVGHGQTHGGAAQVLRHGSV